MENSKDDKEQCRISFRSNLVQAENVPVQEKSMENSFRGKTSVGRWCTIINLLLFVSITS